MNYENYIDYQRREYCKALPCPVQTLLEGEQEGSYAYEQIRLICKEHCIHTAYEFHHYLIQKCYLILRPPDASSQ